MYYQIPITPAISLGCPRVTALTMKCFDPQMSELLSPKFKDLIDCLCGIPNNAKDAVLVFVTQRSTADALCSRIKDDQRPQMRRWAPGVLTGHGKKGDGMHWREQDEMVQQFNKGEVTTKNNRGRAFPTLVRLSDRSASVYDDNVYLPPDPPRLSSHDRF